MKNSEFISKRFEIVLKEKIRIKISYDKSR